MVLLILLLATIVMPVNYRAGTDYGHAHTIFHGLIDAVAGHHHHYDEPLNETPAKPASPFVSAAILLSVHGDRRVESLGFDPANQETDTPKLLRASMPITALASIQALGQLVAALLAETLASPLWSQTLRLVQRAVVVESPPLRRE